MLRQHAINNPPSCLYPGGITSFCLPSALQGWLHSRAMRPTLRLEGEQKSYAILVGYLLRAA